MARPLSAEQSLLSFARQEADSLQLLPFNAPVQKKPWYKSDVMFGVYVSVPLIGSSFVIRNRRADFRSIRSNLNDDIRYQWDNYTQLVPLASTYVLKLCKVPSRSGWLRMFSSQAFAALCMGTLVNSMKYSIKEHRPDNTGWNSFPSGHTATAFMSATLLHKEYGHVSSWIPVAGYTCAAVTGLSRVVNNRHWISDVISGAGIGILSAELGYLIGDLIFKDRGVTHYAERENFERLHNPSHLALKIGITHLYHPVKVDGFMLKYFDEQQQEQQAKCNVRIKCVGGSDAALEGAYYASSFVGFGAGMHLISSNLAFNGQICQPENKIESVINEAIGDSYYQSNCNLSMQNYTLNVYLSYPFCPVFRVQGKFGMGVSHSELRYDHNRTSIFYYALSQYIDSHPSENSDTYRQMLDRSKVNSKPDLYYANTDRDSYLLSGGISLHIMPRRHLDLGLYADWSMAGNTALDDGHKCLRFLNAGFFTAIRL